MRAHVMRPWQLLGVLVAGLLSEQQQRVIDYLREENRVLREQLGTRRLRLNDDQRRRLAAKGKGLGRKLLGEICTIVTPDTILRWHRTLIARKYDGSAKRRAGRPRVMERIRELAVRMATENPTWGYRRICGSLVVLGHRVSRSTVRRILKEHGIDPAPQRRTPWSVFLRTHWEAIAASDFFTVEVWTLRGLVRYHVFFVMELSTRRVEIAGISRAPCGGWTEQLARNLTDPIDGLLGDHRFLIHDRDPLFTATFDRILRSAGVEPVRLPPQSPDLNAYAERFVRSIKSECLDRMIPLGEKHLLSALDEYAEHYHLERPHQGIGNRLIVGHPSQNPQPGGVRSDERLGGLLRHYTYERAA